MLIERYAEYLTTALFEEELRFHIEIERERPGRGLQMECVDLVGRDLSSFLADAYLSTLSDVSAEAVARRMFAAVRATFVHTIDGAAWMDAASRQSAIAKINATPLTLIGDVELRSAPADLSRAGSLLDVHLAMRSQSTTAMLARIGTPHVDDDGISPSFMPGGYVARRNSVWLSPEVVRYPYVRLGAFNAVTFGALGSVIGHELAHALSLQGRHYDARGRYLESWSKESVAAFAARVQCLERQPSASFASGSGSVPVDGRRTLDEDVADLVGAQLALHTMEAETRRMDYGRSLPEWRRDFFIAFAQTFCTFGSDQRAELEDLLDPHAPVRARINNTVANMPAFAETFECRAGARLAPAARCSVW